MRFKRLLLSGVGMVAAAMLLVSPAAAHCDGLDGPVISAARKALETGNPNPVLIWVQPGDEAAIRTAFNETLAVRKLNAEARALADRHFFETLVRLHRAGEGASFTGLKPAGQNLGPVIPLADKAVASGSGNELTAFLINELQHQVQERFADLQNKRGFDPANLAAGREYVESYVSFLHYVEELHAALESKAAGHYPDGGETTAESGR